jgi:hypothetical protein
MHQSFFNSSFRGDGNCGPPGLLKKNIPKVLAIHFAAIWQIADCQ